MGKKVTIDGAGRVFLPKALRDKLRLLRGDTFDLAVRDCAITLQPRRAPCFLQKERGVWVLRTGEPLSATETDRMLSKVRAKRDRQSIAKR